MQPRVTAGFEMVRDFIPRLQQRSVELRILVDLYRSIARIARGDQAQLASLLRFGKALLLVAWRQRSFFWLNPDLQQVHGLTLRWIEFAVANPASCRHALAIARKDHRTGSQTIFVLKLALENVGDDFHVAMRMRGEPGVGRNPIFVDDA